MKKNMFKKPCLVLVLGNMLIGCGNSAGKDSPDATGNTEENTVVSAPKSEKDSGSEAGSDTAQAVTELVVCFGDDGKPFTLHLYDNDTAAAVAKHVNPVLEGWGNKIVQISDGE